MYPGCISEARSRNCAIFFAVRVIYDKIPPGKLTKILTLGYPGCISVARSRNSESVPGQNGTCAEREIFIDNLLVRVHFIIEMSRPALRHGSLNSLFEVALYLPAQKVHPGVKSRPPPAKVYRSVKSQSPPAMSHLQRVVHDNLFNSDVPKSFGRNRSGCI